MHPRSNCASPIEYLGEEDTKPRTEEKFFYGSIKKGDEIAAVISAM